MSKKEQDCNIKEQDLSITQSDEYKEYLYGLYRVASDWIPEIRVQFVEKAYDKYQDKTIRKIVLEYAKKIKELDEYMLRNFVWETRHEKPKADRLRGDVLNHAGAYARTIYFLFDINHEGL